jgi:hypothetical protein
MVFLKALVLYSSIGATTTFFRLQHHKNWDQLVTESEVKPENLKTIATVTSIIEGGMWPSTIYSCYTNEDLCTQDPNKWKPDTVVSMRDFILNVNKGIERVLN